MEEKKNSKLHQTKIDSNEFRLPENSLELKFKEDLEKCIKRIFGVIKCVILKLIDTETALNCALEKIASFVKETPLLIHAPPQLQNALLAKLQNFGKKYFVHKEVINKSHKVVISSIDSNFKSLKEKYHNTIIYNKKKELKNEEMKKVHKTEKKEINKLVNSYLSIVIFNISSISNIILNNFRSICKHYIIARKPDRGLKIAKMLKLIFNDDIGLDYFIGASLNQLGKLEKSVEVFTKCIQSENNDLRKATIKVERGNCFFRMNKLHFALLDTANAFEIGRISGDASLIRYSDKALNFTIGAIKQRLFGTSLL